MPQVFATEDEAMAYYKSVIRPELEQLMTKLMKTAAPGSRSRRLEE